MKIKKMQLSTRLSDLYGKDNYYSHIQVGREYWWYFCSSDSNICKKHGTGWYKIKITYIRSGCMFYIFSDYNDIEEEFCPIKCFFSSTLIYAEIDPSKDLDGIFQNIEISKLRYCFDTEHTIVKNWPNEREIDVDENEIFQKFGNSEDFISLYLLADYENKQRIS